MPLRSSNFNTKKVRLKLKKAVDYEFNTFDFNTKKVRLKLKRPLPATSSV